MTEAEARERINNDITGDLGLIALLERTGEIPANRVAAFFEALDVLALGWKNNEAVPKQDLRPLVGLSNRIYEAAQHSERQSEQIENLGVEVGMHVATLLGYHADPQTEAGAVQLLEERFSSTAGLPFLLRMHLPYAPSEVEEMYTALETLAKVWQKREDIPIRLACVMFDIREAVNGTTGPYLDKRAEIEAIGDRLEAMVLKLLS